MLQLWNGQSMPVWWLMTSGLGDLHMAACAVRGQCLTRQDTQFWFRSCGCHAINVVIIGSPEGVRGFNRVEPADVSGLGSALVVP